jgi:hypothetical protein
VCLLLDAHSDHDDHVAADNGARAGHHDHDGDPHELGHGLWTTNSVGLRAISGGTTNP